MRLHSKAQVVEGQSGGGFVHPRNPSVFDAIQKAVSEVGPAEPLWNPQGSHLPLQGGGEAGQQGRHAQYSPEDAVLGDFGRPTALQTVTKLCSCFEGSAYWPGVTAWYSGTPTFARVVMRNRG